MRPWRPELAILREYPHAHLVIYYQRWLTVYAIDLMIMNRSLHHWSRSPPVAVPAARARERGRTEAERGSGAVCQRRAAGLGSEERTNQTVVARAVGHWGGWRGSWLLHGTSRIGTSRLRNRSGVRAPTC